MKKKIISNLIISVLMFTSASATVVQGNMSDGTPYFYTVSDGGYKDNIVITQTTTETKNDSSENMDMSGKTEDEKYKAEQEKAKKEAEEKKKKEEEAAKKAEEERLAEEQAKAEAEAAKLKAKAKEKARKAEEQTEEILARYSKYKAQADAQKEAFINEHNIDKESEKNYKEIFDKIYSRASVEYYKLEKAAEKMEEAYNKLAEVYKTYGYAGDPVNIATGEYVMECVDFVAQDYLNKFAVKRNYKRTSKGGSFGKGWSSSLDSRIIRCNYESWDEDEERVDEIVLGCELNKEDIIYYALHYQPSYRIDNLGDMANETEELRLEYSELQSMVTQMAREQRKIAAKNKYVTYGDFEAPESYYGTNNLLIYVDDNGDCSYFESEGNGAWKRMGVFVHDLRIQEKADGGYSVLSSDGSSRNYSEYGILESEIDANGNITRYWNNNGKINKVQLKTGEIINIKRNNSGQITGIAGEVSGNADYIYSDGRLTGVSNNSGISVSYKYDSLGFITKIQRADESYISLNYEFVSEMFRKVCSSILYSNGTTESFNWDASTLTMTHITVDGDEEVYVYNKDKVPVYVKDYSGNITEFITDNKGLITSIIENGVKRDIVYDEYQRPIKVVYGNGSYSTLRYNSLGLVTVFTDPDGNNTSINYDSKGNILSVYYCGNHIVSYVYYSNGLVKEKIENGLTTEYSYNNAGSITKIKKDFSDGRTTNQFMEYDSRNRISKYVDESECVTEFKYETTKTTELYNGRKQTEHFYDNRNREYQTIVTDIKTGKKHRKKNYYDWNGNVIKIALDDEVYEECEYAGSGEIKNRTVWNLVSNNQFLEKQGIHAEYTYEKYSRLKSTNWSVIPYEKEDYPVYVSSSKVYGLETVRNLNISEVSDEEERNTYTKGGRFLTRVDKNLNKFSYSYKTNGSFNVSCLTSKGLTAEYNYDYRGLLQKKIDITGCVYNYHYDLNGLLISETGPGYEKNWNYDYFNRLIEYTVRENNRLIYEKHFEYDDLNNVVQVIQNNQCSEIITLDAWNRPVEIVNKDGKKLFDYDVLNHMISVCDAANNLTRIEYDTLGNAGYIIQPDGNETFILHNIAGEVLHHKNNAITIYEKLIDTEKKEITENYSGRKKIQRYDENGYLLSNTSFGTGKDNYAWSNDYKELTVRNSCGHNSHYKFNDYGNITYEAFPSGVMNEYLYDSQNRLTEIQINGITKEKYQYPDDKTIRVYYSNGEVCEVLRNSLGMITDMKSKNYNYHYEYDLSGNMLSAEDYNSRLKVEYSYDNFGRCIQKKMDGFCFEYEYDECGRIKKLMDSITGVYVHISYDSYNRECERYYSNGLKTNFYYNQWNKLEGRVTRDIYNKIISADFVLYDENGRVTLECNKNGVWNKYFYDSEGRLVTCIYPYSDDVRSFYTKVAWNCGIYVKEQEPSVDYKNLSYDEIEQLNVLLAKTEAQDNVSIVRSMKAWREDYEYTETGSISVSHNVLGTIYCDYDKENRLTGMYGTNSREDGMKFLWNTEGNLLNISAKSFSVDFEYSEINRPSLITECNFETNEKKSVAYTYDAFGRRLSETLDSSEGVNTTAYFYDGFTSTLLESLPMMQNNTAATYYYTQSLSEPVENVRWLDDSEYNAFNSFRYEEGEIEMEAYSGSSILRDDRACGYISINGFTAMKLYIDGSLYSGKNVEYTTTDYKGHCVSVVDDYVNEIGINTYDVWGNIVTRGIDCSYSRSQTTSDSELLTYNLGYRDYIPMIKSFTTRDPVRDGSNWYAYCNCDPLNFQDVNGLTIGTTGQYDLMTNYDDSILIGNSTYEKLNENGCYIVTFVNMLNTLIDEYGVENKEEYNTVEKINNQKDMFCTNPNDAGKLNGRDKTMNRIFGDNYEDYFTRDGSGTATIKAYLAKINASPEEYLVAAVFDLSYEDMDISNHMVALNRNFNEEGKIDSEDAITASSVNDIKRLSDTRNELYNINNVKEVRFIKTGKTGCSE